MGNLIKKPIFIIGSGRSGTTVFYQFLSTHSELCWFSNYSDRFFKLQGLPLLHRLLNWPLVGSIGKKGIIARHRFFIKPSEAGRIYHDYCGFQHAIKSTEEDLDIETEKKFKDLIKRHLYWTGKRRFLNKQTANSQRIRLIAQMFRDAFFLHIIRDGRAVASSMLNVDWWNDTDIWWLGATPAEWARQGKPAIELCGLHWQRDVEEILKNRDLFENRYMEFRYEELVADVKGTMEKVIAFCELENEASFYDRLPRTLPDMNSKWKEALTNEQKKVLERTLSTLLKQLKYY
jgi:hypothetical protein